jgi:hypothetical protein
MTVSANGTDLGDMSVLNQVMSDVRIGNSTITRGVVRVEVRGPSVLPTRDEVSGN